MSAWVCGEALMDLFAEKSVVGGGPVNTAKALARLGCAVEFIGGISTDGYGMRITEELLREGVGMKYSKVSPLPTSTAQVNIDKEGVASYLFSIDGSATFNFNDEWLPDPSRLKPSVLHIGSLATIVEPGSISLFEWAMKVGEFAPVVFDPNVRPSFLSDRDRYLASIERWISISSLVKASEEDLFWLYPTMEAIAAAKKWVEAGAAIVVVTRGAKGLLAVTAEEVIEVPGVKVDVVDTVGAGDTVGALLVDALLSHGIVALRGEVLRNTLYCAALAAAITCSRAGAQPPTRSEIEEMRI